MINKIRICIYRYMFLFSQAKMNLLANKLRAFLAILGVLIGSGSVVALLYSSQLATNSVIAKISELGTNIISVTLLGSMQKDKIMYYDIDQLMSGIDGLNSYSPIASSYDSISYMGQPLNSSIVGTSESLKDIAKLTLLDGRFISNFDKDEFCVIGENIAKKTKKGKFIIGDQLKYGSRYCTVIGVLEKARSNFFIPIDFNNAIFMNISVMQKYSNESSVRDIIASINSGISISNVQQQMQNMITKDFPKSRTYFRNPNELIKQIEYQKRHLTILLGVIGGISLVVGGIGIMNIMLVSVVERKREIGIRLAVGAHIKDIRKMFLAESIVLSFFGGGLGVVIGIFSKWPFDIVIFPIILGFSIAVLVGVFFGYYPAVKASRLKPVDALRSE